MQELDKETTNKTFVLLKKYWFGFAIVFIVTLVIFGKYYTVKLHKRNFQKWKLEMSARMSTIDEIDRQRGIPSKQKHSKIASIIEESTHEIQRINCTYLDGDQITNCKTIKNRMNEWHEITDSNDHWDMFGKTLPDTQDQEQALLRWVEIQSEISNLIQEEKD
jgi:hypothetical protein